MNFGKKGFTLVEISVVLGIIAVMVTYSVINLSTVQHTAYLSTTIDTFVSDLKQQQLKAMVGDTEGRGANDYYGVYFGTTDYALFHGSTYVAGSSNPVIPLTTSVQFTNVTFPQSQIVFNKGSGEIVGFAVGSNTITLRNIITNEQKTITINRYGVITQIN
jgi:prepilin-type N-terminal cleavage/methylation domain-containing protein